jgi:hypothetical protein
VSVVYNTFPWANISPKQREQVEKSAKLILDVRKHIKRLHPDCSLADLYLDISMPSDLLNAHRVNDRAVMNLYGFPVKDFSEADCVAALMEMYQKLFENTNVKN